MSSLARAARQFRVFAAAWLLASSALPAEPDGPYVLRGASGWEALSVAVADGEPYKVIQPLDESASIAVPAVGEVPAFTVRLRGSAMVPADVFSTHRSAALFVVADTHGEYQILVTQLRKHGVIDERLRWKFGRGHLVVLGDVLDRGPNHTEILWLLYQLEAEAAKAGGGAHLVMGNHEHMVMRGDLRYLNPKYIETTTVLGLESYSQLFAADTLLGQWLRTRATMLKVNDLLCLHGGVSRELLDTHMGVAEINQFMRSLHGRTVPLTRLEMERANLLLGSQGPLWYRGYFPGKSDSPSASEADVNDTLARFGVKRILVGHTIVPTITPLYEGRVIAVQVYPRRDESGNAKFESLLSRRGEYFRATPDGVATRLELPRRD